MKNMKKVLYTATVLSHICQFHLPYLKIFKEKGYEVHVAAKDNLLEKNGLALKYADKFVDIPFSRSPKSLKNIKAYRQLKKLINGDYYDLIICNTPMGGILTRLAAKRTRKKGTKVVYFAHGFHFYKGAPKSNWLFYYPIEKKFSKKCDVLITITHEDYALASSKFKTKVVHCHGVGVDGSRHACVSDREKLELRNQLGVHDESFICLCIGELNKNKNQKEIIELVPKLKEVIPNFKLWLAGNGNTKQELESKIEDLDLKDCVTLLGYQPQIETYIRASDVIVSVSKREGMPFNIIEAMLAKRPVVVSENRGHRELIKDDINGFITNDIQNFVESIVKLSKDKDVYDRISEQAYIDAQNYTVDAVKQEFFKELL